MATASMAVLLEWAGDRRLFYFLLSFYQHCSLLFLLQYTYLRTYPYPGRSMNERKSRNNRDRSTRRPAGCVSASRERLLGGQAKHGLDICHASRQNKIRLPRVSQQESQLKVLEEEMHSFITSKDKVAVGLQDHVRKLKESFSSRIAELHGFAKELNLQSQLSSEKLNAQVSTHTSDLADCLKGLLADADQLLIGLQNGLSQQEENLTTLVEQQHEGLSRNVERAKSISATTTNFFSTIDAHALGLKKILEESQTSHQKQLVQLQAKFEVCAADEAKYLMEKLAGLLAESNARKKNMVRDDVSSLNKTASECCNNLQTRTTKLHDFTSSMREQWEAYMETTEKAFHKNISSVEQQRCCMVENLQQCTTRTELCSEQWSNAQNSVLALGRSNEETLGSVISDGNEASSQLHNRFSSAVSTALEDNDISSEALVCSIDDSLRLDRGICENVKPIVIASQAQLGNLQRSHHEKTLGISGNANRSLGDDYKVDEPTCSTPRRRQISIPSSQSIEGLVTPLEDLVKSFRDSRTPSKLVSGTAKRLDSATETERVPLTTMN